MLQANEHDETKQRLLDAAGEAFAAKGYHRATIREICSRAGANVASVNYHFGGKKGLYKALLEHCHQESLRRHPPGSLQAQAGPEEALRVFVRSMLDRNLGEGRPTWLSRLMARELSDPSPALENVARASILPNVDRLAAIVARIMDLPGDSPLARRCALSVVGQCLHFCRSKPVIEIVCPGVTYDSQGLDEITNHIVRFSLAALRGLAQEGTA
ncbi:putative HTH-type transcriptional regulator YbiH [Fundidesulfovibrio magnetotacticus]|uniref:Putative HTH-type transcriptional regulator YbiH n=1 Tax=Fundidesulfovibrio magnetotacticus TaxID=2730080 RepID=A0A6V8LX71_9BACT|nr:CerR family C-terminal domain-containing protein [Fundidesulfovibrio magnetotacticus]GFK95490.1 putative HTH-type transcriptional regulator YbiH [Fundidesulfovibrio magnetotacticus]